MAETLPPEYFHQVYAANSDPWNFATSDYEASKYERTVAILPRARYSSAFEIGCSIGVLTCKLVDCCDHLLSVDLSELALKQARERCAGLGQVDFRRLAVPAEYPQESFDITILSEVGYYLSYPDLGKLAELIRQHTKDNGHLLLVHWTPLVPDYPLTGDQVHEYFLSLRGWECIRQLRAEQYRIDLLQRIAAGG